MKAAHLLLRPSSRRYFLRKGAQQQLQSQLAAAQSQLAARDAEVAKLQRALSEKDDVPRRGRVGSPRLLQGSLSDYMPNICASPAGSGSVSPAEALAVACTLTNRR